MIDENRIKHIMAVARLMKEKAEEVGLDKEEMFTLGMLHDIGYEFGGSEEHHTLGGAILKKQKYKYYKEVFYHGKPTEEFSSLALDLLNYADLHIDKKGNYVSFEDRLADIEARRGKDSIVYKNCKKVIDGFKEKGFLIGLDESEMQ
ncbi:MAG: HDIG domain-containing protein [Clostridia bacterium]|nr:HDIG domain-containing protein [Clostridia bacterium]